MVVLLFVWVIYSSGKLASMCVTQLVGIIINEVAAIADGKSLGGISQYGDEPVKSKTYVWD